MKNINKLIVIFTSTLLLFSCKKSEETISHTNELMGKVRGKVVAADNITPIRNAAVFVSKNGNIFKTSTNVNGEYDLSAPIGQQKLYIQSGNGKMFRTTLEVTIKENFTTDIAVTKLIQVAKLGYVIGDYDKIEDIVINSLGYNATVIPDLHNFNNLLKYDAIFLNCKNGIINDSTISLNLANYVSNGGSIYASDWGVAYLIGNYDISVTTCPHVRKSGFIPDQLLCTTQDGTLQSYQNAKVVSSDLSKYLNKQIIDLTYDLPDWEQINYADTSFWEILVKDPTNTNPLLIRTNKFSNTSAGQYNVGVYDSSYITICHKEPALSNPINLTIQKTDLLQHLSHGDNVGNCANTKSGRIYFTTFHNEPSGVIGNDTKEILRYVILNL